MQGKLKIAVASSRMAKLWDNREITWEEFVKRLSTTHRTAETLGEFLSMPKAEQDNIKDVGGFVLGWLKDGCRKAGCVESRSAIALDMDYGEPGIMNRVRKQLSYKGCAYGTHKCSSEHPRLRLIFPLSREISEEEYEPIARAIAAKIGMDYFDDSTYEANRLMFWPSTPADIEYFFEAWDGPLVDPDYVLGEYADWRDISTYPVSSRQPNHIRQNAARQADPLTKPGIVGAFCRAYSVENAIDRFLPDVYEKAHIPGRYTYKSGEGTAGAIVYERKFLYSHHATDPAHGRLLNAFDLVRVHRFPNEDSDVSFRDMADFASAQPEVRAILARERQAEAQEDFEPTPPPFVIYNPKTKSEYVSAPLLAAFIREHCCYIFVRESERDAYQKYVYEGGVYRLYSDDMFKGMIKAQIMAYRPELVAMKVVNETYSQLVTDLNYIDETTLNADEAIINFQNGLLDINTLKLRPHDPAVLSTIQIPCDWNPDPAATPVFDRYISTLTDGNPATLQLLLEFVGAVISNIKGWRTKKALFMVGPGDTGKSQLKALVERIIGRGNYSTMDLEQMEARFGTAIVKGKRLVGSSDMSFMTVKELKTFKKVTGGDGLYMEHKGVDGFEGLYDGFIWFCMNELPRFGGDDGEWVYNRIMPVYCTNIIPPEHQDKEIQDKMYAEREGIVHRAVIALQTVLANGYRFSEPEEVTQNRRGYRRENDSALAFMDACMIRRWEPPKRGDKVTVNVIYQVYRDWYNREYGNQYYKSRKDFYKSLSSAVGMSYSEMKVKTAHGEVLREYTLHPEYFRENNDLLPYNISWTDLSVC